MILTFFAIAFGIAQRACKINRMPTAKRGKRALKLGKRLPRLQSLRQSLPITWEIGNSNSSVKKIANDSASLRYSGGRSNSNQQRKQKMRKVTQQIKEAFEQGKSLKVGNTETDGQTIWLHGNAIVKRDPDGLVRWSLAGWNTPTTRERVNGIANAGVHQVAFEPVLNGQIINPFDWFASNTKLPDPLVW